jgi:hypothetical protein
MNGDVWTRVRNNRGGVVTRTTAVTLVALLSGGSQVTGAQWLEYPTAGVPRDANGKPNLAAPPPRTADGKPDFSGLWTVQRGVVNTERGPISISPVMADVANGVEGGLPYRPWARATVDARKADNSKDLPSARCLPLGPVLAHTYLDPRKIVQVPGLLVILNERDFTFRQIFTDGRPLPKDPNPSWYGYSSATWNGDTLIVETNGFRDGLWLDFAGNVLTDSAKLIEKFRRSSFGSLDIDVTVDDLKAYTRPFTFTVHQILMLDTELIEFVCLENEKDQPHMVGK